MEGVDGAGKSTQLSALARYLTALGHDVCQTREPGGAPGAEEIRGLLVEGEPGRWSAEAELLLFTAARRDHVERTVAPALAAGRIVLCDRYVDSTRAYQGLNGLGPKVELLHREMIALDPDLTLILDLDPEMAQTRMQDRATSGEDRFERKGIAFQQSLAAAFREIARTDPARCRLIDASRSAENVAAEIAATVDAALETA